MKEKKVVKRSISRKLISGFVLMFALLAGSISAVVSISTYHRMMGQYSHLVYGSAHMIADLIDGDTIARYLETKERDDYYLEVRDRMFDLQEELGLEFCYVIVPHEDHMTYVWTSDLTEENVIGAEDAYSTNGKETVLKAFSKTPEYQLTRYSNKEYGSFMAACVPVYDSDGAPAAVAAAELSTSQVSASIRNEILQILLLILVFMVVVILLYYRYTQRQFIRPLLTLNEAVGSTIRHLEEGEARQIDIHTNDEIETLAQSFTEMDRELVQYIAENTRITAEKEKINAELHMAADIQESQLPSIFPPFPERSEFDIYASMQPAKSVGGDFYDFFMVDEDHIALVIADVSGKGVPAALFMMISKILLKNSLQGGAGPAGALRDVNERLMENNEAMQFVTVWLAVVEVSTGKGVAANAGHEHPVIRRAGGPYELVEYRHSAPVAVMEGVKFAEHPFALQPGDSLFVYTDGVAEATNAKPELFGTERMLQALNRKPDAAPKEAIANVMEGINTFVAGAEQFDDITMLCFRYNGARQDTDIAP